MFPKISKTIELQCLFCLITALYIFDLMDIKQNTAAVSGEGWEADHLQVGINLRTVIGKLQCLPVIQIYSVCDIMDDPYSHKASSVYPDKTLRKLLCKLRDGNSCFVHLISQNMNLRIPSIHQNMQNPGRKARDSAV